MNPEVHTSRPTEREAIGEMARRSGVFSPDEIDSVYEMFDEYSDGPEADYTYLSASLDGRLAGFACYGIAPFTEAAYDFYWLCTDPSLLRRGVARALSAAVEEGVRKRGGRLIMIWTSGTEAYLPAVQLYAAIGYTCAGRVPDYYKAGDDLLIYIKYLP